MSRSQEPGPRRPTRVVATVVAIVACLGLGCSGEARDPGAAQAPESTSSSSSTTFVEHLREDRLEPGAVDSAAVTGLADSSGYGRGVSAVDLDGDGWQDLFLADTDARTRGEEFGTSRFYRNDAGTLRPWDLGIADEDVYANTGAAFGDMDGDGDHDVFLVNGNNTTRSTLALYENRIAESGRLVAVTDEAGIPDAVEAWWGAVWVDIEVDGDLDLLVTGSRTALLVNDGGGRFTDETAERGLDAWLLDPIHKNPVVFELDNDGYPDLLSGGGSPAVAFRNDGTGRFVDVTDTALPEELPSRHWLAGFAAAAADFNQDGLDDIYLGRFWYRDYVLLNSGDGSFTAHSADVGLDMASYDESIPPFGQQVPEGRSSEPTTPTTWLWPAGYRTGELEAENTMGLTVGDIDENGTPDVVIGTGDPSAAHPDIVLCGSAPGDGTVSFERCAKDLVAAQGTTRGHGFALADIDRDGHVDLVSNPGGWTEYDAETGSDTREAPKLFLGSGLPGAPEPAEVLLRIDGRTAYGARAVLATDVPVFRTVRGAQGFQSRSSEVLRYFLDDPATLTVTWPGGAVSEHVVHPGQNQVIEEPR